MTIAPAPSINVILPTGTATGPWNTGWTYADPADVLVFIETAGARGANLIVDVDFTLTASDPRTNGGDVALSPSAVPAGGWTADHRLVLARRTVRRQGVALPDAEGHKPRATERALDHAMRIAQEDQDANDRALRLPPGLSGEIAWSSAAGERFVSIGADGVPRAVARPDDFETFGKLNKTADNLYDEGERAAFRAGVGLARATALEGSAGDRDDRSMTPLRAKQQLRTVVEYINPREPAYAGGAIVDGVTDCRAAVQAAIDAAIAINPSKFIGGSIKIKLPAGHLNFTSVHPTKPDRVLDITGADNIVIEGEGMGVTTLTFTSNAALFKSDSDATDTLFRFGLDSVLIVGPYRKDTAPAANTASAGLWTGSMNNCLIRDVQVYACATAISWADCFHTEIYNPRINGLGDLACRDGLYARDGDVAQAENSVGIFGGRIFGCGRYGFRGECITGTCVFGLEVLGCELIGVYLGDSPGSKALKWFTWSGGLIDTCPDLLVVRKGTSPVAQLLHWSGMWMGYAYEAPPGNGVGVEMSGVTDTTFRADMMVNMSRMAQISNSTRVTFDIATISEYDRNLEGNVAILLENSSKNTVRIGTASKRATSPSATAYLETGTSNYNLITGQFDGAVTTAGAQSVKTGAMTY